MEHKNIERLIIEKIIVQKEGEVHKNRIKLCIFMTILTFISLVLTLSIFNVRFRTGKLPVDFSEAISGLYLNNPIFINQIFLLVLFVGLLLSYLKFSVYKNVFCAMLAIAESGIYTLGICYLDNQGILLLISSKINTIIFLIIFLGIMPFFYFITCQLFMFFETSMTKKEESIGVSQIKIIMLFVLGWLPYALVYFPGRIGGDAGWALIRYLQDNISDRHPVIYTYISGFIADFGTRLCNANFGILLNIILQFVLTLGAITFCVREIYSWTSNTAIKKIIFVFYLFYPMIPMYIVTMHTDTIYGALILSSIVYLTKILYGTADKLNDKVCIILSLLFVLTALFRKEGFIILFLSLCVALLLRKDIRIFLIKVMIVFVCLFSFISVMIEQEVPNKGESKMYKYSFLFQQTARYMIDYETEISLEEIEIIDKVLDYEKIKENYNPILSDRIMVLYKGDAEKEEVIDYVKLMIRWFLRHPHAAVDAFINNCYAYFYPVVNYQGTVVSGITKDTLADPEQRNGMERYGWKHIPQFETIASVITDTINSLQYLPLIGVIFMPAFYVWSVIIFVTFSVYKRDRNKSIVLFPYLLSAGVCMLSPANGHFRYIYSILIAYPLLISITVRSDINRNNR